MVLFFRERQRRNEQKEKFISLHGLVESHDKSTGLSKPEDEDDEVSRPANFTKYQVLNDVCYIVITYIYLCFFNLYTEWFVLV